MFVTSRTPSFQNNLGYDADLFTTTGVLGNNQTSTQVRLSTSGDAYQPGVVTIATDLYAPRITATKTVAPTTASLGDTLTYTIDVENTGLDAANGTTFRDAIPQGAVFVPGSIELDGAPVSDAADGDAGEFAGGQVVVRLGTLAARDRERDGELPGHGGHVGAGVGRHDREHGRPVVPGRDHRGPEHGHDRSGHHHRARARPGDRQDARAGALARAAQHVHGDGRQRR